MKRITLTIAILVYSISAALAQNVTVIGPAPVAGNIPIFNSPTIIKDSGIASNSIPNVPLGNLTGPNCTRMWPAAAQGAGAWNVVDAYGNIVSTTGTTSQGLQEAINFSINNGQCLQVYGQASLALGNQSASLNSTTTVTGLTSTANLLVGDYVVASAGGIPLFTKISSIDSATQIHISNAATVTATRTLTFTRPSGATRPTFINASVGISIPPVEQWSFQAYDVNLTCGSTINGPCLQFDSAIIMGFDWVGGQIVYNPGTPTANSAAVLFAPTNPVPLDGTIAIADSHVFISNIAVPNAGGGTAQADINFNLAGGGITNARFTFNELNGTGQGAAGNTSFNVVVTGPTASTSFEQNIIDIAHAHLALSAGIQIGVNTINAGNIRHNIWRVGGIKPSGASSSGLNSFGSYDTFEIGGITNEEGTLNQGINLQSTSTGNKVSYGQIVGAGTALIDGGTCNSWAGASGTKTAFYGTTSGCSTLNATATASGTSTLPASTGTLIGSSSTPSNAGTLLYWNGSSWVTLAGNNSGTQVLQETSAGVPSWTAAGAGSVTTPGAGLVSSTTANCSQAASQTTLSKAECVNAQSGTSYAIADSDRAKLITASNAAAQAYTIAQAATASNFFAGWYTDIQNNSTNANGIVTITATTSLFNLYGTTSATLKVYPGQGYRIVSDGTNYLVVPLGPGGGTWVLLNTLTASASATLSDTTSITSAFNDYEIEYINMVPATATQSLILQVHSGGAFKTTGYLTSCVFANSTPTSASCGANTTSVNLSVNGVVNNAAPGVSGQCRTYNPSVSQITFWNCQFSDIRTAGVLDNGASGGAWNTSGVIDGFQILFASGNITSGTVKIYGRL